MPEPIRVLIVDDHPVVRQGLRAALAGHDGIEVVGDVAGGEAALDAVPGLRPDVVLMDLHLGAGIDGAEATRRLTQLGEPPRILVLTAYESEGDILRAIEAGATGYLLKDADPADLRAAVRTAAAGETVLAPSVATRLVSRMQAPGRALTARECEILQRVADGASNAEIARSLFVTQATVKSHLVQVFTKLDVESRTAAAAEGRRRGLIR
ncbi:MAG TPA: response regulator transcription factor [Segeticoccus sp.]|nr:response regulator transcription factor [Segeticoccus sp.]